MVSLADRIETFHVVSAGIDTDKSLYFLSSPWESGTECFWGEQLFLPFLT